MPLDLKHPQITSLWAVPFLLGVVTVLTVFVQDSGYLIPRLCMVAMIALSLPASLSYQPFDGKGTWAFGMVQALYFGLFMAVATFSGESLLQPWIYILMSGGFWGLFQCAMVPRGKPEHIAKTRAFYADTINDTMLARLWPFVVLGTGLILTLLGTHPLWMLLAMSIAYAGIPVWRNIHPDHDIPLLRMLPKVLVPLLAGLAAYTLHSAL